MCAHAKAVAADTLFSPQTGRHYMKPRLFRAPVERPRTDISDIFRLCEHLYARSFTLFIRPTQATRRHIPPAAWGNGTKRLLAIGDFWFFSTNIQLPFNHFFHNRFVRHASRPMFCQFERPPHKRCSSHLLYVERSCSLSPANGESLSAGEYRLAVDQK